MKAFFAALKRSPKLAAFTAALAGAVIVPAGLLAWGPDRPIFKMASPADHITFNSITDNPAIGDERNFVGIREQGSNQLWKDDMNVEAGKSYVVRMYVHNNAASNLNLVARNVTAKFNLPTTVGKKVEVQGFISASNATPREVYDHATFHGEQDFNLDFQEGSLKLENNHFKTGTPVSESIFPANGAPLGYNALDGNLPGCNEYSGWVSFVVKPQFATTTTFDMNKQVRKSGTTNWAKSVTVNPGDTVEYQLGYKNTSNASQKDVTFRDKLPTGITYVNDSTYLKNAAYNTNPLKLSNNLTTGTGVNVGNYSAGSSAYVKFAAKVEDNPALCGENKYINTGRVSVNGGYKEDTADVIVNKNCAPGEINVCELATRKIITIKENDFDSAKHSKNLADCASTPVELPQTGVSTDILAFAGIGGLTAAAVYAVRSARIRNLLRG